MSDANTPRGGEGRRTPEHEGRVRDAFASLDEKIRGRLDRETRDSVEKLRAAAVERDAARLREHLTDVKERHGWLYRELAEHPQVALLLDELALWGF